MSASNKSTSTISALLNGLRVLNLNAGILQLLEFGLQQQSLDSSKNVLVTVGMILSSSAATHISELGL